MKKQRERVHQARSLYRRLQDRVMRKYARRLPIGDLLTNRWENARRLGFGDGASCYDSVLVFGDVSVGANTWLGPNCILDGSGGLSIGSFCSISAGVQIYTHDTVKWATTFGQSGAEHGPVSIGDGVYIGPQCVIQRDVSIGDRAVIGACSFVNRDVPAGAKAWGCPARVVENNDEFAT